MTTLLVDCHAVAWRAAHAHMGLSSKGESTSVIFGFFQLLSIVGRDMDIDNTVFCWDSGRSKRKQLFPNYKKKPEETEIDQDLFILKEETVRQINILREEVFPSLKYSDSFIVAGMEADDILASIVNAYPDEEFIIATGDDDILQLLSDKVSIYSLHRKRIITEEWFQKEYGISPKLWGDAKALMGCKSDNVPGIPGIGPSNAIKYLQGTLKPSTKAYEKICCTEGKQIFERNCKLVKLPFYQLNISITNSTIRVSDLRELFKKYEFYTLLGNKTFNTLRNLLNAI